MRHTERRVNGSVGRGGVGGGSGVPGGVGGRATGGRIIWSGGPEGFCARVFRSPLAAVLPLALVAPQIVWTKTGNNRERLELSRKLRQSPQLLSMLAL
jgi:hypothetical protein